MRARAEFVLSSAARGPRVVPFGRRPASMTTAITTACFLCACGGAMGPPPNRDTLGMRGSFLDWPVWEPTHRFACPMDPGPNAQHPPTLGDVAARLGQTLRREGGYEVGWFHLPVDGFAAVTKIEPIDERGARARDAWKEDFPPFFSRTYLRQLLFGKTGRYRVWLFVVTDEEFEVAARPPTGGPIQAVSFKGSPSLPDDIGAEPVGPRFHCFGFLYEMTKVSADTDLQLVPAAESRMNVVGHLAGAHLPRLLEGGQ
jgi:hypothetical protein